MGLDMYLYLRKYESCGRWDKDYEKKVNGFYPEELKEFAKQIDANNFMSKETKYQVGYWRKVNSIHHWFVEECAEGEDNCRPIYVPLHKLQELKELVDKVLANRTKANELLPNQKGFFFGSQDYDEWYFKDLEYTQEILNDVIKFVKEHDDYDIIYQASW